MPSANWASEFNMMMRFLTLLLCIGCNVRSCWLLRWNKTSRTGEEVELNCTISGMSQIFEYVLWQKETTQLFVCVENNCSKGYGDHELVTSNFSSILKIPNVSLDDEGSYTCEIHAEYDITICYITLTTNVPPEKLILFDNDTDEILNKSLKVINGTELTLRCQTSTSVKPTVNLEWIIPEGLQVINKTGDEVDDEHNRRLVVPTKTLSFILTNKDHGKNITCIFNSDNDAESLKTSVYFTTEDISSPTSTTYNEVAQQDNVTTPREPQDSSPSAEGNEDGVTWQIWLYSAGFALFIALSVITFKIIVLRKTKKQNRKNTSTPDVRALRVTPRDQLDEDDTSATLRSQSAMTESRPVEPLAPGAPMLTLVPLSSEALVEPSLTGPVGESSGSSGGSHSKLKTLKTRKEGPLDPTVVYSTVEKRNKAKRNITKSGKEDFLDKSAQYAIVNKKRDNPRSQNSNQMIHIDMGYQFINQAKPDDSVPHVHKTTSSGMVEYAMVTKPRIGREEGRTQVPHSKVPNKPGIEYAEIDFRSKKNRQHQKPRRI